MLVIPGLRIVTYLPPGTNNWMPTSCFRSLRRAAQTPSRRTLASSRRPAKAPGAVRYAMNVRAPSTVVSCRAVPDFWTAAT